MIRHGSVDGRGPVAGAIEFNGTNLFYTDSGNTRRTFASTSYVDTAVSNGTASAVAWTGITGKPTTIAGFGITNAITTTNIGDQTVAGVPWTGVTGKPTTISGYGITDAITTGNIASQTVATAGAVTTTNSYTMAGLTLNGPVTVSGTRTISAVDSNATFYTVTTGAGIASGTTITAVGDITAFSSDRRLKENFRPITDAVSKVVSLNGVIYNWNSIANELAGYDRNVEIVGLIAQELEAVCF
jgi:hypothetical protein